MTHQKVRQTKRWTDNLKLNNIRIIMFFQTSLLNFLLCLKSKIRSFIRNFIFLILFFTTLYQLFVRLFNQSSIFFFYCHFSQCISIFIHNPILLPLKYSSVCMFVQSIKNTFFFISTIVIFNFVSFNHNFIQLPL